MDMIWKLNVLKSDIHMIELRASIVFKYRFIFLKRMEDYHEDFSHLGFTYRKATSLL